MKVLMAFLGVAAVCAALTGCNQEDREYTMNAAAFTAIAASMAEGYDGVAAAVAEAADDWPAEDQAALARIDANMRAVIAEFQRWGTKDGVVSVRASRLLALYGLARENYLEAEGIISRHQEELPVQTRYLVADFRRKAQALEMRHASLVSRPDTVNAADTVADIAAVLIDVGRVVVPVVRELQR